MTASTPARSVTCGARMYVRIPAKRGMTCASSGRYGGCGTERIYWVASPRTCPCIGECPGSRSKGSPCPRRRLLRAAFYPFQTTHRLASKLVGSKRIHMRRYATCTGVRMRMSLLLTCFVGVAAGLLLAAPAGAATYAKGVDVSNWQATVDWLQVGDDGYTFMFAKASEGTTFTDITYPVNRAGALGVGMHLGAYHFARPAGSGDAGILASAVAQADHFVDVAQPRAGDLPPVLDLEANGGLTPPALVKWTQAWVNEVTARTG